MLLISIEKVEGRRGRETRVEFPTPLQKRMLEWTDQRGSQEGEKRETGKEAPCRIVMKSAWRGAPQKRTSRPRSREEIQTRIGQKEIWGEKRGRAIVIERLSKRKFHRENITVRAGWSHG